MQQCLIGSVARIAASDAAGNGKQVAADGRSVFAVGFESHHRRHLAAVDPAHDEERPLQRAALGFQRQRLRHRHDAVERPVGQKFGPPVGVDQAADGIAAQDHAFDLAADLRIEAIGLAAGAAGNPGEIAHRDFLAPLPAEISLQLLVERVAGSRRVHDAKSSVDLNPEGACGPSASCSSTPRP